MHVVNVFKRVLEGIAELQTRTLVLTSRRAIIHPPHSILIIKPSARHLSRTGETVAFKMSTTYDYVCLLRDISVLNLNPCLPDKECNRFSIPALEGDHDKRVPSIRPFSVGYLPRLPRAETHVNAEWLDLDLIDSKIRAFHSRMCCVCIIACMLMYVHAQQSALHAHQQN